MPGVALEEKETFKQFFEKKCLNFFRLRHSRLSMVSTQNFSPLGQTVWPATGNIYTNWPVLLYRGQAGGPGVTPGKKDWKKYLLANFKNSEKVEFFSLRHFQAPYECLLKMAAHSVQLFARLSGPYM